MDAIQPPDSVLELRGVRKRYRDHVAVDQLDLSLRPAEFMTFLGPSGSGKTTTLMMVAGLQQPDAGVIMLGGKPVTGLPPYRRDIGMVFQNYALFPHMNVRRNVAFALEMRGIPRPEIERQVVDILRLVGLPEHGQRLPRELSGGQQQRVALARAMVYRPALLLMDEPLGALDRALRGQLQLEIMRLHRERQMAVLYVTHDQEEALTMSDRIAIFNSGRIEQVGTPEELYERPATRFAAGFIGEMNFLAGNVIGTDGAICRVRLPGWEADAMVTNPVAPGTRVVVAVRPERILLAHAAGGSRGTLEALIYLGNSRKYTLRLSDGQSCSVLVQSASADADGLRVGDAVSLGWRADHASLFPA